ncbi:MAG TPA: helix-turn-helix domain-containing protein [Ktedonobacterales bacterium]
MPLNKELTTQEAADLLNVSRPFLIKLLEQGGVPFAKTGSHRRIRFSDLMAYKHRRDADRQRALARLTQMSQEVGLYE